MTELGEGESSFSESTNVFGKAPRANGAAYVKRFLILGAIVLVHGGFSLVFGDG